MARVVVPKRAAIEPSVSPSTTVYWTYPLALGVGVLVLSCADTADVSSSKTSRIPPISRVIADCLVINRDVDQHAPVDDVGMPDAVIRGNRLYGRAELPRNRRQCIAGFHPVRNHAGLLRWWVTPWTAARRNGQIHPGVNMVQVEDVVRLRNRPDRRTEVASDAGKRVAPAHDVIT